MSIKVNCLNPIAKAPFQLRNPFRQMQDMLKQGITLAQANSALGYLQQPSRIVPCTGFTVKHCRRGTII